MTKPNDSDADIALADAAARRAAGEPNIPTAAEAERIAADVYDDCGIGGPTRSRIPDFEWWGVNPYTGKIG